GMVTEADWNNWTIKDLQPYFRIVLESFTPKRLMFGSDWPVCLLASSYQYWYDTVMHLISPLSDNEKKHILGKVALKVYNLLV
ncbi:MAG: amidohydrolase, partial [Bacteroidetes bacterium]